MRLVHFCFGMNPDFGGRPFGLSHYLSIRSAWEVLCPDAIILHCAYEPSGIWWDLASPMLMIHRVNPVKGIYGFPVSHPAHQADIIRLAALIAMGGIYADTDVLFLKSFDNLPDAPFLAAQETLANGMPVGLSNAVLIAVAESSFARLCLEGHDPARSLWKGFRSRGRDENYVEYSVRYPSLLAQRCPGMLEVLPSESFLSISWEEEVLKNFFEGDKSLPPEALAVHLWESHSWEKYLSHLSLEAIHSKETAFNHLVRRFLPEIPMTRKEVNFDLSHLKKRFEKMDQICREVDFIKDDYLSVGSTTGSFKRKLRKFAGQLRNELLLPLRCRMDRLERQLKDQEWSSGVPHIQVDKKRTNVPLCRLGIGDGSDKMLARVLKDLSMGDAVSYLISTADGCEPSASHWLALRSESHGTWISASLSRAQELQTWAIQTGRLCSVIHGGISMGDWERTWKKVSQYFQPTVLILTGTGKEYWQWQAMKNCKASIVLLTCNPAFAPESDCVIPWEHEENESGILWGASLGALRQLGLECGYLLKEISQDGQFLIFSRHELFDSEPQRLIALPVFESITVRSLYGDTMEISKQEARNIVSNINHNQK